MSFTPQPAETTRLLLVGALIGLLLTVAIAVLTDRRTDAEPAAARSRPESARALSILTDWDRRRSRAWADGDAAALRRLYAPGSEAGRRDVAMLRQWRARGLRVVGLRMQVLDVTVAEASDDRVRLVVTDRVHSGRVVGPQVDRLLPRDRASRRQLTLLRVSERWVLADIVEQGASGPEHPLSLTGTWPSPARP